MIKSAEYIQFEEGFIKSAVENGCDEAFLRGYIKEADDMVETFREAFDKLAEESGDPLFKVKLANDIIYFAELEKLAEGDQASVSAPSPAPAVAGATSAVKGATGGLQALFASHPEIFTSLLKQGGIGGLIGLIFGAITGHPIAGLMTGALGGAGMSAFQNFDTWKGLFSDPSKPQLAQAAQVADQQHKQQSGTPPPAAKDPATGLPAAGATPPPAKAPTPPANVDGPTPHPAPTPAPTPGPVQPPQANFNAGHLAPPKPAPPLTPPKPPLPTPAPTPAPAPIVPPPVK